MDYTTATLVSHEISELSTYYKSMDITAQITQLNALQKLLATDFMQRPNELNEIISRRKIKLQLSLDALYVLEKEWDTALEREYSFLKVPYDIRNS